MMQMSGPVMNMRIAEPRFNSCLTRIEKLLEREGGEALCIFESVTRREFYRVDEDYLMAVFLPQLRRHIHAYYRKQGPCMIRQFKKDFIRHVDEFLVNAYKQAIKVWSLMKDQVDREGIERSEFLSQIRLVVASQQMRKIDLELHYLKPGGGLKIPRRLPAG